VEGAVIGTETPARVDSWLCAVPVLGVLHVVLMLALHVRPGLPAVVLWHVGPIALTAIAVLVMAYGLVKSSRWRLPWTRTRAAGYVGLLAVSAMPLAYETYPSSRDGHPSQVRFRLPLDGPVTVAWGGPARSVNYHVVAPAQRWAYDLLVRRAGRSFRENGTALTDYYAYGLPVLAPAEGVVRFVSDGAPDKAIGVRNLDTRSCGNRVVIEVAREEFLFLCHLQAGSIGVQAGERVVAGQVLARVGNSGRSSEPHLHVHLQTTPQPDFGEGIPLYFHDYRHDGRLVVRGVPTGGRYGQVVEHAGERGPNLQVGPKPTRQAPPC
jgi:murein DD-endopeptidase MepM/ murein hydrolase activator NlpD